MAHPEHLKAAAMAALLSGESAHRVARRFDQRRTVQNAPQKRIGEGVLGYVGESIETQRAQMHAMMDREWLLKQSARDLAMLHGTLFDRMVGVVVAFEKAPGNCTPDGADERA